MSDIEERPSKIRKLNSLEDSIDAPKEPSDVNSGNNNGPEYADDPCRAGSEENDSTKISVQDQTEGKPPMSKRQLKKLKKQEQWEAGLNERRAKRREKQKERKARKADERAELQEKIAKGEIEAPNLPVKKGPKRPIQTPVGLVMDCDFDELMTEKELISLGAQLTRCYSDNRTSPFRSHLAISSWNGKLRTRFETVLANNHHGWKGVRFSEKDFVCTAEDLDGVMRGPGGGKLVGALAVEEQVLLGTAGQSQREDKEETRTSGAAAGNVSTSTESLLPKQVSSALEAEVPSGAIPSKQNEQPLKPESIPMEATSPKPSLVYLTADSPNTLDKLSPNTSYIIGGIVDKNRHKGICYKRACERGIPTAKLPIGEYMTMQSRSVLTVNHVVEIMLKWLETGDWGEAFLSVIPKRKEAKLKVKKNGADQEDENGEEEDSDSGEGDGGEAEREEGEDVE